TRKASQQGLKVIFEQRDMLNFDTPDQFDAALCLYTMPGLANEEDCCAALLSVNRVLRAGGLVVLNVMNASYRSDTPLAGATERQTYVDLVARQDSTQVVRLNQ